MSVSPRVRVLRGSQFHQAAVERWRDAECLLKAERGLGAVYLAGYVLECYLKFIICERAGVTAIDEWEDQVERQTGRRPEVRGQRGHHLQSLLEFAGLDGEVRGDAVLQREFAVANQWEVSLHYHAGPYDLDRAGRFLEAVRHLRDWLRARL